METAETSPSNPPQENLPIAALASAVAGAAVASLLAWTFLPATKRRASIAGQVSLGVLTACAAAVIWQQRQQEADAAHQLFSRIHEVRDARWLKKNPIAYG